MNEKSFKNKGGQEIDLLLFWAPRVTKTQKKSLWVRVMELIVLPVCCVCLWVHIAGSRAPSKARQHECGQLRSDVGCYNDAGWDSSSPGPAPPHYSTEQRTQGEKVAISREMRCQSSLVCLPLLRFCNTSLNCIIPTGVRQKAPRALRMMLTKSS